MTNAVHPQPFHPHSHAGQVKLASGLNCLAGIYLLISGWIGGINGGKPNAIIFGIIVAVLAGSRFSGSAGRWAGWIDALIGLWLIISPWVYGYAGDAWMWNSIVIGIIMFVLGVWSASADSMSMTDPSAHSV